MFALAFHRNTYFTQEDYVLEPNTKNIEERFLKYYANLLDDFYSNLKESHYSPAQITPKEAAKLYTTVLWFEKSFSRLEKLYSELKNDSFILMHIYENIVGINEEFQEAKECLFRLKNPKIHQSILKSVNFLQNSDFFYDK